jgi:hypothetical protein
MIEEFKKKVSEWSRGLEIRDSKTKEELERSLKSIHWSLECELHQEYKTLREEIESLDIPD